MLTNSITCKESNFNYDIKPSKTITMLVIQETKLPNPSLPQTLYQTRAQTSTQPPKTSNTTKTSRRSLLNKTLILSSPFVLSTSSPAFSITNEEQNQSKPCQDLTVTQKVYMDVSIDGEPAGRMVIGLFGNDVPRGARRFADLAMGTRGVGYRRKEFVKVTPSYIQHAGVRSFGVDSEMSKGGPMAGSDLLEELRYVSPKCSSGTFRGAVSLVLIDPFKPPDETKLVARDGKLVMRSQESRPDPNGTEFVISTKDDVSELRSIALLIGRVIDGLDVLDRISSVPSVQDNTSSPYFRAAKLIGDKRALVSERGFNRPFSKIVVTKCGEI